MNRVAGALLMIATVVCAIGWASCAGDPPPMLVDAKAAQVQMLFSPCPLGTRNVPRAQPRMT